MKDRLVISLLDVEVAKGNFKKELAEILGIEPSQIYDVGLESEYINGFIKIYKKLDCWSDKIMLKAITLNPGNKSLRKSYYADNKFMNISGLVIMAGGKLFDSLCKEDKKLVYLNKEKITSNDILSIAELMYYDNKESISQDVFPYNLPYYYKLDQKCIADGVHEYINYMNDKYDLSNNMEKLFLLGISKRCANM